MADRFLSESIISVDSVIQTVTADQIVQNVTIDTIYDVEVADNLLDTITVDQIVNTVSIDEVVQAVTIDTSESVGGGDGDVTITVTAAAPIATYDVVAVVMGEAYPASRLTASHLNSVVGIATSSAAATEALVVQTSGEIQNPLWAWTLTGRLFVGVAGAITQTAPDTGFMQRIGKPLSSDTILIDIDEPIDLT